MPPTSSYRFIECCPHNLSKCSHIQNEHFELKSQPLMVAPHFNRSIPFIGIIFHAKKNCAKKCEKCIRMRFILTRLHLMESHISCGDANWIAINTKELNALISYCVKWGLRMVGFFIILCCIWNALRRFVCIAHRHFMNEMAKCIYRSSAHMPFHAWNVSLDIKKETWTSIFVSFRFCFLWLCSAFCRNFDFRSINHRNGTLHETVCSIHSTGQRISLAKYVCVLCSVRVQ